jgi:hypothetical protein
MPGIKFEGLPGQQMNRYGVARKGVPDQRVELLIGLPPATKASCNIVVTGNAIVCLFSAFDAQRIIQQLREAFPEVGPYRHAIFDHDSTFNDEALSFLKAKACRGSWPSARLEVAEDLKTSGNFPLDLPPEFAHPANRPRQTGLRGSERILLISEPAHVGARFHPN